jgi:hypothetical protein
VLLLLATGHSTPQQLPGTSASYHEITLPYSNCDSAHHPATVATKAGTAVLALHASWQRWQCRIPHDIQYWPGISYPISHDVRLPHILGYPKQDNLMGSLVLPGVWVADRLGLSTALIPTVLVTSGARSTPYPILGKYAVYCIGPYQAI